MSKVKIELDHNAVAAFLCSEPVESMVKGYADRAVQRLGTGHKAYTITWTRYPKCAVRSLSSRLRQRRLSVLILEITHF